MAKLDARALLAVLDKQEESGQSDAKITLRQYHRWAVRGEAELYPLNSQERLDHAPTTIQLRDIGLGGMGFVASGPLAIHSLWQVAFSQHGYPMGRQTVIVRSCRKLDQGLYLIGSQFCIEVGLMCMLGIDPGKLRMHAIQQQATAMDEDAFLPPDKIG